MSARSGAGIEAGDRAAQAGRLDEAEKLYARADADDPAASGKLGVLREHHGERSTARSMPSNLPTKRATDSGPCGRAG
jgi:hypothetical protein